jgi:hypothetical protein
MPFYHCVLGLNGIYFCLGIPRFLKKCQNHCTLWSATLYIYRVYYKYKKINVSSQPSTEQSLFISRREVLKFPFQWVVHGQLPPGVFDSSNSFTGSSLYKFDF